MTSMMTPAQVSALIMEGQKLFLAGSEDALSQLPRGEWIGGTIPYFMTEEGGVVTNTEIHVTRIPDLATQIKIRTYSVDEIASLPQNYFGNGFSFILIPAFSEVHQKFAEHCSTWPDLFNQPLVGWITGVDLNADKATPQVINGQTGKMTDKGALVMHVELPASTVATANIINIFKQGQGDTITFPQAGFEVTTAKVNGQNVIFADYLTQKGIDLKLPLVADYMGAMINVSFRKISDDGQVVHLYAPIFQGVEYKLAVSIDNYEAEFEKALRDHKIVRPLFACNCILNFLYANLEGKKTGNLASAMTFGEVAYMLLNQTFVYVSLSDKKNLTSAIS